MICQIILLFTILRLASSQNSFRSITDCVCSQDVVTYECTVCGLATAWEGTALGSCSGGEIALTNRDFMAPIMTIVCSGGRIAARGIIVEDGCFASQLNITFNATALQGRSVRCSVDNGTHASEVGRDILTLTTDPYPPPDNVYLVEVSPMGLLFSWNQTQNCPSLRYNINQSENCGQCQNTTTGTSVNCSDFTLSNSVNLCTFAVQAVICGNNGTSLFGNFSDFITVNLTVPTINQVTTIPHYHTDNGLRSLTVLFSEVDPFIIYEGINGTVISYMVYFSDSDTEELCGSNEVYCDQGTCSTEFDISSVSSCRPSSDINVTISALTSLGGGPLTVPIMEKYRNNFVSVQVISESVSITCAFLNVIKETEKSCNATITYGDNCQDQVLLNGVRDNDDDSLVVISLRSFLEETMSSKYCAFRVNATAGMRAVTVEGNLFAVQFRSSDNNENRDIIAGVVSLVVILLLIIISIVVIFIIILYWKLKRHQKSENMIELLSLRSMDTFNFEITPVLEKCKMIDFAMKHIENYDPDSGYGYFQFSKENEEYVSPKTEVVLVGEDKEQRCTGSKARKIIGVSDKRELLTLPDLSGTPWKYVFIQSTSRVRMLSEGTHFLFYGQSDIEAEQRRLPSTAASGNDYICRDNQKLQLVTERFYKLKYVPQECSILDFAKTIEGVTYNAGFGYGFYEFTKPEIIQYDKQVILMDENKQLYHGPGARYATGIGSEQNYDETEEIEPKFDTGRWKHVFIQTRSNVRKLQPDTWFLYCDIASCEMIKVLEPFEVFLVTEDEQKLVKFAKKNVTCYNPRAGYGYYEFAEPCYVLPTRNVMALKKNGELFTGPGVRQLIGASGDYDENEIIKPPDLSIGDWDGIFIQGKRAYGRLLPKNSRFLYCEYDYCPENY